MIKVIFPLSVLTAFLLTACGSGQSVQVGEADKLLPDATAADWRTYADHLVVAEVVSEKKLPMSEEENGSGEGFADRLLTFRIDKVLWSNEGAEAAPTELTTSIDGWTVHDGKETPFRFSGEPEIVTGHTYVMPVTYLRVGRLVDTPGWMTLSVVPADDGEIGKGDTIFGEPSEVESSLLGKPVSAAVDLMVNTPLPDVAKPFMGLPPTDRLTAITKAQEKSLGSAEPSELP
ncbi:hypothetical protein [Nocardioides sp. Kera G14]|uniref:hypothetical protein n=1 Tax=Nocardioides sp. Kera G14 TaxID=2884264 RepID=UPI001D12F51C|nr:hypothetical protein [Nocardioides sp. Kera G14]UDY24399.1 hypothetical protein LH076_03600 [Nocardioides sp. Kera G14]